MSLLGQAKGLGGTLITSLDLTRGVSPLSNQVAQDKAQYNKLYPFVKGSEHILSYGDVIVRRVANGLTVTVYKGEGASVECYVATIETLADVIKLAGVASVLNGSK